MKKITALGLIPILALVVGACGNKGDSGAEPASGTAGTGAPATAAGGGKTPELAQAIADVKAMKPPATGDARSKVCSAMKKLAESANECDECLDAFLWGLKNDGADDIGDCCLDNLPTVSKRSADVCAQLATSLKESRYGSYEMGAIATQGAACKGQMGDVADAAAKKMLAYADAYKDIGPAYLIYVERLWPQMSADQKKKIQDAARELEKKAREKKRDNVAEAAKKLSEMK